MKARSYAQSYYQQFPLVYTFLCAVCAYRSKNYANGSVNSQNKMFKNHKCFTSKLNQVYLDCSLNFDIQYFEMCRESNTDHHNKNVQKIPYKCCSLVNKNAIHRRQ